MSELDELTKLQSADPEAVKAVLMSRPDLRQAILDWDDAFRAGDDVTVDGFKTAYKEFLGRELPYVFYDVTEEFVWAFHNKKGVIFEGWRGLGKSTYFAAWCPYVMGVRPVGSTALIRVNDQKAKEMGKLIAGLIETNPGWKRIFSHVVPDEKVGWSVENGFNVLDTRVTGMPGSPGFEEKYARWRMACMADHLSEQSLICAGVESGSIIGLHPTNGERFDDLHDEINTRSQAEMKKVVDVVNGNIKPTWFSAGGSPTLGVFCTPWSKNPPDAYQAMLETGLFKHIKKPIYVLDKDGEIFPPTGERIKLTWPELFPMARVEEMHQTYKTRFGQMCLLDVELSKPKNMRYQPYPAKEIGWSTWPMTAGVDPVGTVKGVSKDAGISYFAVALMLKSPYNSLVVADGIVEKIDALEGERRLSETQRTYSRTYQGASIEMNGAGTMFIAMISRTSGIKYHSHTVGEIGPGNKKERQYRFLQPLFASGSILVSDADTPFLNAVREYLDIFPNFDTGSYLEDVGDALAIGALDVPEIWTKVVAHAAGETIWTKPRTFKDPYAALLADRR